MEKNALATVDLAAMLQGVVRLSLPAAEQKGLYLRAQAPTHLAMRTDRVKLERILNNLVSNAVKFTERGGVRVEVERAGAGVEIHVIDTGIGIAPEAQERLFDEFYQLHNRERDRRKGFGLGLSIARRLARHLGGDVTVDSAPGRGSRFSVVLPTEMADDSAVIRGGPEPGARRTTSDPIADDFSGIATGPKRGPATEL
jgi:signal transduction histidine kinase